MRKRVYHPETNEPFDVPSAKADMLVLEKGWLQTPIDPTAVAAVQDVPKPAAGGRGSRSRRNRPENEGEAEAQPAPSWQSLAHGNDQDD